MTKKRKKDIQTNSDFFENTLVRYRPISPNNLDSLKGDRLYYSTPNNFNDPYDTLIYANYMQIIEDIKYHIDNGMDNYLEKIKYQDELLIGYVSGVWNSKKKDQIVEKFLEDIYKTIKLIKEALRKNLKIICFSEEYLSMLMWSHYADNHRGFAIIYDKNIIENAENYTNLGEIIGKKPILKQVTYAEEQSDLTTEVKEYIGRYRAETLGEVNPPSIPNLSQEKLRIMITEKSPDWNYEKEWRIIPRHISLEHESNLGYMSIKPKGIIIGSMCSEESQRQLIDICDKKIIPVFKAELNYWEPGYKLVIVEPESCQT